MITGGIEFDDPAELAAETAKLSDAGLPFEVVDGALQEPPCVQAWRMEEERKRGWDCPRRELAPENVKPARLFSLLLAESPIAPLYFTMAFGRRPPREQEAVLMRVWAALNDPEIVAMVRQRREAAAAEAREAARAR